jgi:uncharacterized protein (TIGR02284 family)
MPVDVGEFSCREKFPNPFRCGKRFRYMMNAKEITSTINNLIETLKDGEKGFKEAADAIKDPELKLLFTEYSAQRHQFASQLQTELRSLGGAEPETGGSAAGAMHRGWIDLKSAISGKDEGAILAECERGEDSAVKEFKEAIEKPLSSPLRDVVFRQSTEIKRAHDRIKQLRDAAKKAA